MNPNDLTVVELKDRPRELGYSSSGTKTELVRRLRVADLSGSITLDLPRTRGSIDDTENACAAEARAIETVVPNDLKEDDGKRSRESLERELELVRRELELLRSLCGTNIPNERPQFESAVRTPVFIDNGPRVNVATVADLLSIYKGEVGEYENWEKQLHMICRNYELDARQVKTLISMQLKGKALEWFYSRPEHIEMSVEELLIELRGMYHHRQNRIALRRAFEERVWRRNETFHEYVHEKVIMGNKVPIAEDELVDYLIDGIPDVNLRDQARIHKFRTKTDLLEAFEQISLRDRSQSNTVQKARFGSSGYKRPSTTRNEMTERTERRQDFRGTRRFCYNCGSPEHMSDKCPTKNEGAKCFRCQERGHIAVQCPKARDTAAVNDVASQVTQKKCIKDVEINGYHIEALIDTGSDFCLMRADQYIQLGAPRLQHKEVKFTGVGSTNTTLGEFYGKLTVDGNSYTVLIRVVSDSLMSHQLIIGTDFLETVELRLRNGNISISPSDKTVVNDLLEIYQINIVEETKEKADVSHIPAEHQRVIENLVENYEPAKSKEIGVQMSIVLKDDEPIYQRARRLSPSERDIVNEQIQEWLDEGIVQPSLSEYASPIVLVKKKNGSIRLCVNYRLVNKKIVKDRYPLPLIDDQINSLQGAKYYSTLDLQNGFFHVPVEQNSRKYTAFIVPDGHYEFLKVPFGLCNSPAVFQKYVNAVFKELIRKKLF
ncbi:uncharacterized protein LOC143350687 [Colletes latitarsis]|uniref:uncharacterized protein LOC143350687 n=1 Tax=Colletes latitarsis TaxID=2605962 RepID=UPI004036746F